MNESERWQKIEELADRLVSKINRKKEEARPEHYSERDILEILRANRDLAPKREKGDDGH